MPTFQRSTRPAQSASSRRRKTRLGPLDILVNNAGIIRRAEALDHSFADWQAVMSVNLDAVWLLSQAAARSMAPRALRAHRQHRFRAFLPGRHSRARLCRGQSMPSPA